MCASAAQDRHRRLLSASIDHRWTDMHKAWETGHSNTTGISGGQTCILPTFSEFSRSERYFILIWLIADYSPTVFLGSTEFFLKKKTIICCINGFVLTRAFGNCIDHRKILKTDGDMGVYVPGYEGKTGEICPQTSTSRVFYPPRRRFFLLNSSI